MNLSSKKHKVYAKIGKKVIKKLNNLKVNSVVMQADGYNIPPIRLRELTSKGNAFLAEDFLLGGEKRYRYMLDMLNKNGVTLQPESTVLDFGVGCGRVARFFLRDEICHFFGTDVDGELVEWCLDNLSISTSRGITPQFITCHYQPPLQFDQNMFDFAYALSVFTHMEAEVQKYWMEEMWRVLKPEGYLLLSFLEKSSVTLLSGVLAKKRIDKNLSRSWLGKRGAPEVYFNTYNTYAYMKKTFRNLFDIVSYEKKPYGKQSIILFRKKA